MGRKLFLFVAAPPRSQTIGERFRGCQVVPTPSPKGKAKAPALRPLPQGAGAIFRSAVALRTRSQDRPRRNELNNLAGTASHETQLGLEAQKDSLPVLLATTLVAAQDLQLRFGCSRVVT